MRNHDLIHNLPIKSQMRSMGSHGKTIKKPVFGFLWDPYGFGIWWAFRRQFAIWSSIGFDARANSCRISGRGLIDKNLRSPYGRSSLIHLGCCVCNLMSCACLKFGRHFLARGSVSEMKEAIVADKSCHFINGLCIFRHGCDTRP